VFVQKYRRSCGRASCPSCLDKWGSKSARRIKHRLTAWSKGRPIHVIFSPPASSLDKSGVANLRRELYAVARKVGLLGGCAIFHPYRKSKGKWVFSPHFHTIGYGWIDHVRSVHRKTGWVVKNVGVRESVYATARYLLSHAGVHPKQHTTTWFGRLSYNKLKVEKLDDRASCPICGDRLVRLSWCGVGDSPNRPDMECCWFDDPRSWVDDLGYLGGVLEKFAQSNFP